MRTTVKQLIAALGEYPPDAVVLVPDAVTGRARDLITGCREIMEVRAKRIVRSKTVRGFSYTRGGTRRPTRTHRIRFTEYECRRYGHGKVRDPSGFPVKAVYFNLLDE
jgi:hypothetical protein